MDVVNNCRECWMYKGCEDCALKDTEYCTEAEVLSNGSNRDIK